MNFSLATFDLAAGLAAGLVACGLAAASQRRRSLRFSVAGLALLLGARYFVWRSTGTLDLSTPLDAALTLGLLACELYAFAALSLFFFQALPSRERRPPPARRASTPSVDVLVPIYDEPVEVLRPTLVGCAALEATRVRIVVCDDGRRPEIEALARSFGAIYVPGPRTDGKVGALNHALSLTSADLVAVLDCDQVPVSSFLRETVPYFADRRVAVVQTAHHFYNPDVVQKNLRLEGEIAHEEDLFFHVVQPGRDASDAALYVGSAAVLRREALEEIGGFPTRTLAEDLHASALFHARGWKTVYLNRDLSACLAPEDLRSHVRQRCRRARGSLQVLFDGVLFRRSLTFRQRLAHLARPFGFLFGLPRIVFLTAPLPFLLFGRPALRATLEGIAGFYLPYFMAATAAAASASQLFRRAFWSDVYETLTAFPLAATALGSFLRPGRKSRFVRPKGLVQDRRNFDFRRAAPFLGVFALLVLGLWLGIGRAIAGGTAGSFDALAIHGAWAAYNAMLVAAAFGVAIEQAQKRRSPRVRRRLRCLVTFEDGTTVAADTKDLSEGGASLDLFHALPGEISVRLSGHGGETRRLSGRVVRIDQRDGSDLSVGLRFLDLKENDRRFLLRQMFTPPDAWDGAHGTTDFGPLRSLGQIASALFLALRRPRLMRRVGARFAAEGGCALIGPNERIAGRLEDLSLGGARVVLERAPEDPQGSAHLQFFFEEGEAPLVPCDLVWGKKGRRGELRFGLRFRNRAIARRVVGRYLRRIGRPAGPPVDEETPSRETPKITVRRGRRGSGALVQAVLLFVCLLAHSSAALNSKDPTAIPLAFDRLEFPRAWETRPTFGVVERDLVEARDAGFRPSAGVRLGTIPPPGETLEPRAFDALGSADLPLRIDRSRSEALRFPAERCPAFPFRDGPYGRGDSRAELRLEPGGSPALDRADLLEPLEPLAEGGARILWGRGTTAAFLEGSFEREVSLDRGRIALGIEFRF